MLFVGEYLNSKRHGRWKEILDCSLLIYEGEYKNGFREGFEIEHMFNYNLEGEIKNGKINGYGITHFSNGDNMKEKIKMINCKD